MLFSSAQAEKLAGTKLHLHATKLDEATVLQGVYVRLCGANWNDRHALTKNK